MPNANCDIGLIGLAVMGQNLVLNMNDHGYRVAVFNRTVSKVDECCSWLVPYMIRAKLRFDIRPSRRTLRGYL